jgi:hypothetical protein
VNRVARVLLLAAVGLILAATAVLATTGGPTETSSFEETSFEEPSLALPTTAAPTTTTTAVSVVVTTPPTTTPPPPTAPPTSTAPRAVTTTPPTSAVPAVRVPSGRQESCGWAWDAMRMDDGSLNEVSIYLDAPRRPNEAVTITAKPGASLTSTPAMSQGTTTDGGGQAGAKFSLTNDKRDWMITISATFAAGGVCAPQTITLVY